MKIGIIGGNGKIGNLIALEALNRNLDVTLIVRKDSNLKHLKIDLFDLNKEDLKDFDVVISAFNAPNSQEYLHVESIKHLINICTSRLMVVGGAGSLLLNDDSKLKDSQDFPKEFFPTADFMSQSYDLLKQSNLNYTYISPSAFFNYSGDFLGSYQIGFDHLLFDKDGNSTISYKDYASAFVDEIINAKYLKKRITFCNV